MAGQAEGELRIFSKGSEGYQTLEAWGKHDALATTFPNYAAAGGVSMTTHLGQDWPTCEMLKEAGCVRPKLLRNPIDQVLADWTLTNGTWSLVKWAGMEATAMMQADSTEDLTWTAETVQSLPEDPRFELFVWLYPTSRSQNWTASPPYLIVELGDYRVWQVGKDGTWFCVLIDGKWVPQFKMDWETENLPGFLWWDPVSTGLSLSVDQGQARYYYQAYPDVESAALSIPSGKLKVYGCGHAVAALALNELMVVDGQFDSLPCGTYENRGGVYVPDVTTWARKPKKTNIVGTDLSAGLTKQSKYRSAFTVRKLTKATEDNLSFIDIYRVPELWAVDMVQGETAVAPLDWSDPLNYVSTTSIRSATIEYPVGAGWTVPQTCRIEIPWESHVANTMEFRFRFALLRFMDWRQSGQTDLFYGTIINWGFDEAKDGDILWLDLTNSLMLRAQTVLQEEFHQPLGGMTDLNARNAWLKRLRLPTSRASWKTLGITLPKGDPREPWGCSYQGSEMMELLQRIDDVTRAVSYFDATDGKVKNLWKNEWNTTGSPVSFYNSGPAALAGASDRLKVWDQLKVSDEGAQDLVTRWKALGENVLGGFAERATDWAAEENPAAANFIGFPKMKLLSGVFPDHASARLAVAAAYDVENQRFKKVSFTSPGLQSAKPPFWCYIRSSKELGNTDPVQVLALRHRIDKGEWWTEYEGVVLA